ncbi:MAG TPA: hypothetical protein VGQ78_00300, partial [Vicinamibacteria bacterium]|nr:hypothetical protein [Vicinamibacteria bacterium]
EEETGPGALYASGLIAAGGVFGLLAIALNLIGQVKERIPALGWVPTNWPEVGKRVGLQEQPLIAMIGFALLAFSLYYFARKPLETPPPPKENPPGTPDLRTEA